MLGYIAGFIISLIAAGIISVPSDKELQYAFKKAKNYDELAKIYEDSLNKKSDLAVEGDYVKLLLHINDKKAEQKATAYLAKKADVNIMQKLCDYYVLRKEPQKCEHWLTKAYEVTKDDGFIAKKIDLGFTFEKFSLNKQIIISELKIAATKNRSSAALEKAAGYFAFKKDYESYAATLEIAFLATKNPSYSKKLIDVYSFVGKKERQKNELTRYYELTKDYSVLTDLYGVGEQNYAIAELEKNLSNLQKEEIALLKNIYLWSGANDKYYDFIKRYFKLGELEESDLSAFVSIAALKGDTAAIKDGYGELFRRSKNAKYLLEAAELTEYAGKPELSIPYYESHYAATKDSKSADRLIAIAYALGDYAKIDKYEKQKSFDEKNITAVKALLINKARDGKESQALADAKEYISLDKSVASFELYALLASMSGFEAEAKKTLRTLPAAALNKESLYAFVASPMDDIEDAAYLKRYYDETNDTAALKRAGEFGIGNGGVFAFALLERFLGELNPKNLFKYLDSIPSLPRQKAVAELVERTSDSDILNSIGSYYLSNEDVVGAKNAFLKTLTLDRKNLLALEFMGKIESWNNNPKKALEYFLEYDALSPLNPVVCYYLAELYKILEKPSYSGKYYKVAIEKLNRKDKEQNTMYIKSVAALRSPEFVKKEFGELIKTADNNEIYSDYIESLYHAKKYDMLNQEFKEFEKLEQKSVRLQKLYAYTMTNLGRYKEALAAIEGAQKILDAKKERDASIFFDKGYIYEKMDEPLNALTSYNRGLRLDPNNQNAIEAKSALRSRLSGHLGASYAMQGELPTKAIAVSMPAENVRVGVAAQTYYNKTQGYATLEDVESKKYLLGVGSGYAQAKYTIDAGAIGKYTLDASLNKIKDYKEAIIESLSYREYGVLAHKKISPEFLFSGYYYLRDYIFDGSVMAKASLADATLLYEPKEKLVFFYKYYAQKIKKRYTSASALTLSDYRSDTLGAYRVYDVSSRLSITAGANLVAANDRAEFFGSLGVDIADILHIGYASGRDNFSGELQKIFELSVKYKY